MKFIADRAIPHIHEAFSTIGEVELLPASEITPSALSGADGLLARTTVKITSDLLADTGITFIGTATIGTDHIDLPYLRKKGIHLASAPGCNANAVGEYVLTALYALQQKTGISLQERTLGIIGAGNTGKAVQKKLSMLGIKCILNDPPLVEQNGISGYLELDELVQRADIISMHVPLTRSGKYPTAHLFNERVLQGMKPDAILINSSRGETLDGEALKTNRSHLAAVVLDVWENEPGIDSSLFSLVDIATPHIAGYSIEGKVRATEMIYRAACSFFNRPINWKGSEALLTYGKPELTISRDEDPIQEAVKQVYDIWTDDSRLRQYPDQDNPDEYFADLRNNYQFRREFSAFQVDIKQPLPKKDRQQLSQLGFRISDS